MILIWDNQNNFKNKKIINKNKKFILFIKWNTAYKFELYKNKYNNNVK